MRTGIILSAFLEPLDRKKPALIKEEDLKLSVLEALQEGPLNILDLSKKTEINQRKLSQILSSMEEEETITKLKTRYEITETGLGIVTGFIEPSEDERVDVIATILQHPNSSIRDLLRLRSKDTSYLDIVKLTSTLDVLRDKEKIERNGSDWILKEEFLKKLTGLIENKPGKETEAKEKKTERPKPKIIKEEKPVAKKQDTKNPALPPKDQAKPPVPPPLPPLPPPNPDPIPPSNGKPVDPETSTSNDLPSNPAKPQGTLIDPFTFRPGKPSTGKGADLANPNPVPVPDPAKVKTPRSPGKKETVAAPKVSSPEILKDLDLSEDYFHILAALLEVSPHERKFDELALAVCVSTDKLGKGDKLAPEQGAALREMITELTEIDGLIIKASNADSFKLSPKGKEIAEAWCSSIGRKIKPTTYWNW